MNDTHKIQEQEKVYVRYIVHDVGKSVDFYTTFLNLKVEMQPPGNAFAMLSSGNLYLLLNSPGQGGAGQTLADGSIPAPGGWNRVQIRVDNLEHKIEKLRKLNAPFKSELIKGNGGAQILLQDPSENLIELFESYR